MQPTLGIDLGGTFIKAGLVDANGKVNSHTQIATGSRKRQDVVTTMVNLISSVGSTSAVGLAVPGGMNRERTLITQSPNFPDWNDFALPKALSEKGVENITMENDANCAVYAEMHVRNESNGALFSLGTGVGGGLILNNQLWTGSFGMAGELGHIPIFLDGRPCGCGSQGCLEQYASASGIQQTFYEITQENLDVKDIAELARRGETQAKEAFELAGKSLGVAIACLINVLNLPLFCIGGGVSPAFDMLESTIWDEVKKRAYREPVRQIRIEPAMLGNDAGLIGAAMLAKKNSVHEVYT